LIPVDARILASFEDAPGRSAGSDFLLDSMETEGCFERVLSNAIAKTGGRGVVSPDNSILLADEERLRLNRLDEEKLSRIGEESP
jgi:predicted methyltransferase